MVFGVFEVTFIPKRPGEPDYTFGKGIAQGLLEESRYYLILSRDLHYGDSAELLTFLEETSKLLAAYIGSIRNSADNRI